MFGRRQQKTLSSKFSEAVWPAMGLKRSARYWRHRIVRLKDSNYSIAMGLAIGAAISFTPLPGAHMIGAVAFCLMLRVNVLAGLLGTLVGNPWTIPFMWWFSYFIGKWSFIQAGFRVRNMPAQFEWKELVSEVFHDPMRLFMPWLTGGFIVMLLSLPLFYIAFHGIIHYLRSTHHLWRQTRLHKNARSITGQSE